MTGYVLVEKGKDRPITIDLFTDLGNYIGVLVFKYKKDIISSTNIEKNEEIRKVEIKLLGG